MKGISTSFERAKKLCKTTLGSFAQARALIKLVTNIHEGIWVTRIND